MFRAKGIHKKSRLDEFLPKWIKYTYIYCGKKIKTVNIKIRGTNLYEI
jgi:hypothetical protein